MEKVEVTVIDLSHKVVLTEVSQRIEDLTKIVERLLE